MGLDWRFMWPITIRLCLEGPQRGLDLTALFYKASVSNAI